MIKAVIFDLARTLLFPKDETYSGGVNDLYDKIAPSKDFKFFDNFKLNKELLDYIEQINKSVPCYIFTSEGIQNDPALSDVLRQYFKKIYSAMELGKSKKDPETYKFIANDLKIDVSEVLFIDDSLQNITAAETAGMRVIQYKEDAVIPLITEILHI